MYHFVFPSAMDESCSATLPVLSIFWIFSPCNRCEVVSHRFLICSTLVTNGAENHFMSLFAICISSFMRCLFRSPPPPFFPFTIKILSVVLRISMQTLWTIWQQFLVHIPKKNKSHVIFNSFLNRVLVTFQLKICRQEFH